MGHLSEEKNYQTTPLHGEHTLCPSHAMYKTDAIHRLQLAFIPLLKTWKSKWINWFIMKFEWGTHFWSSNSFQITRKLRKGEKDHPRREKITRIKCEHRERRTYGSSTMRRTDQSSDDLFWVYMGRMKTRRSWPQWRIHDGISTLSALLSLRWEIVTWRARY